MTKVEAISFDDLNNEYTSIINDMIRMFRIRQKNEEITLKVIEDADNGIGLSEPFDNVDDLMVALNA